jgi:hypothetical protein
MKTEVKRSNWSRFCKRFTSLNQYRPVKVRIRRNGNKETEITTETPLMGIALTKRGRFIDGVELFTAQTDPDRLSRPAISIKEPVKIVSEKDKNKNDNWLMVEASDGTQVQIDLAGEKDFGQVHTVVEKLAYTMYERRGHQTGHDAEDWLEAERLITETADHLRH